MIWHVFKFGIKLSFDKQLSSGQDRKRKKYEDIEKTFLAGLPIKFEYLGPQIQDLKVLKFFVGKVLEWGKQDDQCEALQAFLMKW